MILVDTSIWIDHLRTFDSVLAGLLEAGGALIHPFVIGELACGDLHPRDEVVSLLRKLPQATVATDDEALRFIDQRRLMGLGIGYIDVHLLAATSLTPGARLWTRGKRLAAAARRCHLGQTFAN